MSTHPANLALADLAEIDPPVAVKGLRPDSRVSFIPMADVAEGGGWRNRQSRRLGDVRNGYTPFVEGDILFAKITPCMENGKGAHVIGLENGVGFGSTEFFVLRIRGENDAKFIFHWLQAKPTRIRAIAFMGGSAGQQRVQSDFFRHFRIPEVKPAEQRAVAAVLDAVDSAIEKTAAVIAKLKQVRAGLLHDLLTRGLDANGELRDPLAHPGQFQDSPLGKMPKDWNVQSAKGLCFEITKGTTPPVVSDVEKSLWIPFIRVQNLTFDGTLTFEQEKSFLPPDAHLAMKRSRVLPGDVLMNLVGPPLGKVSVVPPTYPEWNINQAIAIFRPLDATTNRYVAFYLLSTLAFRWFLRHAKKTSGQMNLTLEMCRELPVPWQRDEAERKAITDFLVAKDQEIACEMRSEAKLHELKIGLMSDLLTGRVPVPETITTEDAS